MHRAAPSRRPGLRPWGLAVAVVFLLALTLRVGHLAGLQAGFEGSHLFDMARADAAHHWNEALEILDRDPLLRDRVPWKGPGYSYFLAGLVVLLGRSPERLRWFMALVGALNCAGLVLLARSTLPARWSVLAGGLAAINGLLILFDGELFFPTLLVALNLPALWLLGRPQAGWRSHAGAGLLLGLAALVHPVYLLPAAALGIWALTRGPRLAAAFFLALALTLAPVSLTNLFVRGQPVLISWNGGINLYAGNQPGFDQFSGNRTSAWSRILQSTLDAGIEQEYERDRFYYRLALKELARHPVRGMRILASKLRAFLSPVEYANNIGLYELRGYSPVLAATMGRWGPLWWPFGVWAPAAIIGLFLMLRKPSPLTIALSLWCFGLLVSMLISFNAARYRAPIVFFGCIFVAGAVAAGLDAWRERRPRRLVAGAALYLLLAASLSAMATPQRGFPLPLDWDEAAVLASRGRLDEAQVWVERALDRAPRDGQLQLAAAGFYAGRERRDVERDYLRRMLELRDPEPDLVVTARALLARSYRIDGLLDEARREIRAAIAVGIDETEWHGAPYFQLGLGPLTRCWLQLQAAEIEIADDDLPRARQLIREVRSDCREYGRLKGKLLALEARAVLAAPR